MTDVTNWTPPEDVKPWIVCAANRFVCGSETTIVPGPRHFDETMYALIEALYPHGNMPPGSAWEQGFIDQFGRFYTREEAMKVVKENGQPFNADRQGGQDEILYSEGLY